MADSVYTGSRAESKEIVQNLFSRYLQTIKGFDLSSVAAQNARRSEEKLLEWS